MIYTRKKNPGILDFFVEKSEILGGFYLQKKKRVFSHKKKKKRFAQNRKKMWKNFCRPPNVFWRQIRHQRLKYIKRHFFPRHNHDIWVKKWKNSEKILGFFLVSAEISALRVEKQHLLKKFFLPIFSMHLGEYCLKVSNFSPSYKKSYLNVTNTGEDLCRIEHENRCKYYISLIYIYILCWYNSWSQKSVQNRGPLKIWLLCWLHWDNFFCMKGKNLILSGNIRQDA